jgi:hypothetical protein
MKIVKDGIDAEVIFPFFDPSKAKDPLTHHNVSLSFENAHYKRFIKGTSKEVYTRAARVASRIGLSEERSFNHRWNRTLLNLLNKPSENKTMINLGIYKPKNQSGLYDVKTPGELLSQKIIASKIPSATFAARAGVDEATLFRHLAGTFQISREITLRYSNILGCDPSELLFNPLEIPVWGDVDTQNSKGSKKHNFYTGEIIGYSKEEYTLCPREIYRPDVKAIRINSEDSFYHNHVAFYYNSNEPIVFENQLVVVGLRLKNSNDNEIRWRYFFGIYKKNKNNKTVDILNPDPEASLDLNINHVDRSEAMTSKDWKELQHAMDTKIYHVDRSEAMTSKDWKELQHVMDTFRYVIKDIKPEFVAPVVALVNHSEIKEKENFIRDHNKFYNEARKFDLINKHASKEFMQKNFIINQEKEKIRDEIDAGSYKYDLSDAEINQRAEKKAEDIYSRMIVPYANDLFYSDLLKSFNKRLKPGVRIKTDKGIKNFFLKTRDEIKAVREDLTQEEIDEINQIDDHLNDLADRELEPPEEKKAV